MMEEQSGRRGICHPFSFEHLPQEIQLKILSFLDLPRIEEDFISLNLVSKHMRELAWDGSLYKKFNFDVSEDLVEQWPKPPFVLEKLEKVTIHLKGSWLWAQGSGLCASLTEIVNKTPRLRFMELRGHRPLELNTGLVDIIKGNEHVEFALVDLRVKEDFFTELGSSLRQVPLLEFSQNMYLSANNLRLVADNCGKLRSFSATIENNQTALEYFFEKTKSTLIKVEFGLHSANRNLSIETMRVIGTCVKLQKLTLCGSHMPLAPLKHLKYLKELDICVESDLSEPQLSCFGSGFPFLEKLSLFLTISCHVSEATFEVISRSFGKLKCLELRHFPDITDKGLNFLKRAKALIDLRLEYFPKITNQGVLNILKHLESLEYISTSGCLCVRDDNKSDIESFPNLVWE